LIALFQLGYSLLGLYFAGGVLSRALHYCGLALLFATQAWHYAPYSIN